jgi:hypothetical protein
MTALVLIAVFAVLGAVGYCLYTDRRERRKIEARHWIDRAARRQL